MYFRKPIIQPIIEANNIVKKVSDEFRLIKNRSVRQSNEMPETSPSSPSSKLNEFKVPTIKNIRSMLAGITGSGIPKILTDENLGKRNNTRREAETN